MKLLETKKARKKFCGLFFFTEEVLPGILEVEWEKLSDS